MRVLLLGAGRMGSIHARTLEGASSVSNVSVFDTDTTKARRLADRHSKFRCEPVCPDGAAGFDAVIVATPAHVHADQVTHALTLGLPVLCEKPLALSEQEFARLEGSGADGAVMVGFQRRFDRSYLELRAQRSDSAFYRLSTGDTQPPPLSYLLTSGGIFQDMLIHDFDMLAFLSDREIVSVMAEVSFSGLPESTGDDWGTASVSCLLDNGDLGVLTARRTTVSGYEAAATLTSGKGIFTAGIADERSAHHHIECPGPPRAHEDFTDRFTDAYRNEVHHFLACVEDRAPLVPSLKEARAAFRAAVAAELSARSGQRVPVTHDDDRRPDRTGEPAQ